MILLSEVLESVIMVSFYPKSRFHCPKPHTGLTFTVQPLQLSWKSPWSYERDETDYWKKYD